MDIWLGGLCGKSFLDHFSLDTAIASVLGNPHHRSVLRERSQHRYLQSFIAATISGHPCETISSARWYQPPAELSYLHRPRPLRNASHLFGLDHRTMRDRDHFLSPNRFNIACHLARGGLLIEEHHPFIYIEERSRQVLSQSSRHNASPNHAVVLRCLHS